MKKDHSISTPQIQPGPSGGLHQMDSRSSASVSVALCTLNAERYLPELLSSLAAQSLEPQELVICDDGSTDATLNLLETFASRCSYPVRIFRNPVKLRPTKNFEKAISLCTGDLIALCDADDVWRPRKLAVLADRLETDRDAGGVFSDADLIDGRSAPMGERLWERAMYKPARTGAPELECERLLKGNVVTGATLMVRSSLRAKFMPIPENWIHDGWIAWMLVLQSKLLVCDQPLIEYRIHSSQETGMPGLSPKARLRRSRQTGSRAYYSDAAQFADLLRYLEAHREICDGELLHRIDGKRQHDLFRAELTRNRLLRWMEIVRRRPEYTVYAQGWLSMLKDALT